MLISTNDYDDRDESTEIFEYAWSKKYLDFTRMDLANCTVQHYNPFTRKKTITKVSELFPDKLRYGVHGYPIKLAVGNFDSVKKIRENNNSTEKVSGVRTLKYHLLLAALQIMNFSLEFVELPGEKRSYLDTLKLVNAQLVNDEADLFVRPIGPSTTKNIAMLDLENDCDRLIAFVPRNSTSTASKLFVSPEILVFSALLPLFVGMTRSSVRLMTTPKSLDWSTFEIISVFFGMSVQWKGQMTVVDRAVFLYVIAVSALYSLNFYSSFLDIGLVEQKVSLDTFEDLGGSKYKIYLQRDHLETVSRVHGGIAARAEVLKETYPCLVELSRKDDRVCIALESLADGIKGGYQFHKAKPTFNCLRLSYHFGRHSPYLNNIGRIFRRIYESGIEPKFEFYRINNNVQLDQQQTIEKINLLVIVLIIILTMGHSLALVAFLIESSSF